MTRTGAFLTSFMLITTLLSCRQQNSLTIEPINPESNEAFLSGKDLDSRLYSIKNVYQYYQVKGYKHLPPKDLAFKLDSFVRRRYPVEEHRHRKSLMIWFYKDKLLNDYADLVYESARENENGSLTDHADDILALAELEFLTNGERKLIRHNYLYYPEESKTLSKHDTVSIE